MSQRGCYLTTLHQLKMPVLQTVSTGLRCQERTQLCQFAEWFPFCFIICASRDLSMHGSMDTGLQADARMVPSCAPRMGTSTFPGNESTFSTQKSNDCFSFAAVFLNPCLQKTVTADSVGLLDISDQMTINLFKQKNKRRRKLNCNVFCVEYVFANHHLCQRASDTCSTKRCRQSYTSGILCEHPGLNLRSRCQNKIDCM